MPKKSATRYVAEDGTYLSIDYRQYLYYIAWYIPEDESFGGYLGDTPEREAMKEPTEPSQWDCWAAEAAVKPLADGRDSMGYFFESERDAKLALKTANQALLTREHPWPAWAIQAKEAGWTPPTGWKP